ncbi:hypothetical protein IHP72_15460 [Bacillus pumilus]|uniref:hypothetical protein n=1 Tax=Bacillus pumilus TaxID=1408 RepID=UPI001B39F4E6|nr:hypothetical protein [Bacillus pumilus]MBQ4817651.1 hypothetical protein [Bacillus pumilus]
MIHVLKDEKLGVDREYVAVDRNAEVGDKLLIVKRDSSYEYYSNGDVFTTDHIVEESAGTVISEKASSPGNRRGVICREEYHVLEPTDIVHIDGERYRLEDRKAEVGECVIHVNKESGESNGIVTEAIMLGVSEIEVRAYEDFDGDIIEGLSHGYYYVLTPVQDAADTEPKESDVITVLANLGVELSELKRTVSRHQAEINALHEDKVRLGEQLAKVVADDPKALAITTDELAQIIVSLSRAGL